jgi:hypothetical protein
MSDEDLKSVFTFLRAVDEVLAFLKTDDPGTNP